MTVYFSHHEKIIPFDEIFEKKNIPAIGHRDANGYLVLPVSEKDDGWDDCDEM